MLVWLDLVPNLAHDALFVDQKGLPVGAHELLAIHQRTTSPVARRLHALLRYCPGYQDVCNSPRKTAWVVTTILQLSDYDLPAGCLSAARELHAALPFFAPKLTRHLTIDQLCKIMVEEAYASEQARKHQR